MAFVVGLRHNHGIGGWLPTTAKGKLLKMKSKRQLERRYSTLAKFFLLSISILESCKVNETPFYTISTFSRNESKYKVAIFLYEKGKIRASEQIEPEKEIQNKYYYVNEHINDGLIYPLIFNFGKGLKSNYDSEFEIDSIEVLLDNKRKTVHYPDKFRYKKIIWNKNAIEVLENRNIFTLKEYEIRNKKSDKQNNIKYMECYYTFTDTDFENAIPIE